MRKELLQYIWSHEQERRRTAAHYFFTDNKVYYDICLHLVAKHKTAKADYIPELILSEFFCTGFLNVK